MEETDRAARSQALSLLKKKLSRGSRTHPARVALDNAPCETGRRDPKAEGTAAVWSVESDNQHEETEDREVAAREEPQCPHQHHDQRGVAVVSAKEMLEEVNAPPAPERVHNPQQNTHPRPPLKKLVAKWSCTRCQRECIPIREESRCLCGHRYKEHPSSKDDPLLLKNKARNATRAFEPFACTAAKCACRHFFYVVAEGAWILRCRCKHKHTDHDPSAQPFPCRNSTCACQGFGSPWVCNCDHPWNDHIQETVEKEFRALELFQDQFVVDELSNVQRTDLRREPLRLARG